MRFCFTAPIRLHIDRHFLVAIWRDCLLSAPYACSAMLVLRLTVALAVYSVRIVGAVIWSSTIASQLDEYHLI